MKKILVLIPMMILFNISYAQTEPKVKIDCTEKIKQLNETIEILKQSVEVNRIASKLQKRAIRKRDSIITIQDSLLVRFRNNIE